MMIMSYRYLAPFVWNMLWPLAAQQAVIPYTLHNLNLQGGYSLILTFN